MTHGTLHAYALGCRCADCKAVKAESNKQYARARAKEPGGVPSTRRHDDTIDLLIELLHRV